MFSFGVAIVVVLGIGAGASVIWLIDMLWHWDDK
jgi:hypothetical protein